MEEIAVFVESKNLDEVIYEMEEVMAGFPSISIDEINEKKIVHGSPLFLNSGEERSLERGNLVCLKSRSGSLLALGVFEGEETRKVKIDKVLIQ